MQWHILWRWCVVAGLARMVGRFLRHTFPIGGPAINATFRLPRSVYIERDLLYVGDGTDIKQDNELKPH